MINLWPLLLPAAAWSGWWVARRNDQEKSSKAQNRLSHEYVVGLNYLLNEQQDKAVDLFIKLLEVDSETVETHLALGSLFRRRGEVDRAIRIHQNLIARPQLSELQRKEALMALGKDYMSAGVFDRAERIFLEVLESGGLRDTASLQELVAIYQQEKAWEKALQIVKKLEASTGTNFHSQAAHYYCEMAESALSNKSLQQAAYCVKQALSVDKNSVRASLMYAEIEISAERYKQAVKLLKRVPEQDPDFISEIINPLVYCYQQMDGMKECVNYFKRLTEDHPRASMIFVIADYIRDIEGLDAALDFVADRLSRYPSIRGLNRLIYWHLASAHGKVREKLEMLYNITSKFLDNKPVYRCGQCGFGGKHLHWHCPSCKQWGKMKPIYGLEGD